MRKKIGRPRFQPSPEQKLQVLTLAANGFPDQHIADYLDINFKTLTKYFAEELRASKRTAAAKLKLMLYQKGLRGEIVPALSWLNNHKWGNDDGELLPPPPALGISFADGGPGRVRKTPYDPTIDPALNVPPGADRLGDSVPTLTSPEPVVLTEKEFKAIEPATPAPPVLELWERLGETQEQFHKRTNTTPEQDWGAAMAERARLHRVWGGG